MWLISNEKWVNRDEVNVRMVIWGEFFEVNEVFFGEFVLNFLEFCWFITQNEHNLYFYFLFKNDFVITYNYFLLYFIAHQLERIILFFLYLGIETNKILSNNTTEKEIERKYGHFYGVWGADVAVLVERKKKRIYWDEERKAAEQVAKM